MLARRVQRSTIVIALLLLAAPALAEDDFVLIVNQGNPVTALSLERVSEIFLKKEKLWRDGSPILPVDLDSRSRVRVRFARVVHGKSIAAIKSYWQKQIFTGRGVPPAEKKSDAAVVEFVAANAGAIGYVSRSAVLNDVRIVPIRESGTKDES